MLFSEFIPERMWPKQIYAMWPDKPVEDPEHVQRYWLARSKKEMRAYDVRVTYGPDRFISWAALSASPVPDDSIYRVSWNTTKHIEIMCFGMYPVDSHLEGYYSSMSELPDWIQEAIGVLSILPVPPPPNNVDGVGQRVGETTYWVYHP